MKREKIAENNIGKLIKRWGMFCISLFVMAIGVAFAIRAELGTSPISSFPYVMNKILPFSFGQITMGMHCILVLLQIIILRKDYKWIQLVQIPVAVLFGFLSDWTLLLLSNISYDTYWQLWILCIIGILLVALGVSMEISSKASTLAGEGFVLAVCQKSRISVGNMKIIFDCSLVGLAVLFSLIFLHELVGVREGTAASMILVGSFVKTFNKIIGKFTA